MQIAGVKDFNEKRRKKSFRRKKSHTKKIQDEQLRQSSAALKNLFLSSQVT